MIRSAPEQLTARITQLATPQAVAQKAAGILADALGAGIAERGWGSLALSGGRTPIATFHELRRQPLNWRQACVTLVSEVDAPGGALRLADSKEGESVRPAGRPLLDYLATIKQEEGCASLLAPARAGATFGGMPKGWKRIAKRAGFEDVTLHTLRHSYASAAADLGYSEPTIAAMLGHAVGSVTGATSTSSTVCSSQRLTRSRRRSS